MKFNKNASNLHKLVGFSLRLGPFAGFKPQQEVPVTAILPGYPYKQHRFDWIIDELLCVFECHGEQHYRPVSFKKENNPSTVISNFRSQQQRDKLKEQAAIDAGYTYVIVNDTDTEKVTPDYLYSLYLKNKL